MARLRYPEPQGVSPPEKTPSTKRDDALLTVPEVCERLKFSRTTVHALIQSGALLAANLAVRTGANCRKQPRVRQEDLRRFVESRLEVV